MLPLRTDFNSDLYPLVLRRLRRGATGCRVDVTDKSAVFSCILNYVRPVELQVHIQFAQIRVTIEVPQEPVGVFGSRA